MSTKHETPAKKDVQIINVWKKNLRDEFGKINKIVEEYPFVAMDTEFPGVVATPVGQFKSKEDFNYQLVSCNVNMLKLIQVGLTFMNSSGHLPPENPVWQFNFEFNLEDDMYSTESVELLRKCGIDFPMHEDNGISMLEFGELLTTSGLLTDPKIHWLTFSSGYDFGYLMKAVLTRELPKEEKDFFKKLQTLFPSSIDIKLMLRQPGPLAVKLRGGLQEVASMLQVTRYGMQHQAGSDSLLTGNTFFAIKEKFFSLSWDELFENIRGELYGLGNTLSCDTPKLNSSQIRSTPLPYNTNYTESPAIGSDKTSKSNSPESQGKIVQTLTITNPDTNGTICPILAE
uniref:Poly(A)-specific ribonuclease n=1 Tax=Rhabditophanes sp. KR3021 TaxID=114890 RepID=A0AC35TXH2_9BILA